VIEHLNRVGAVLLGKAAMIELAGGMGYRFASASLQSERKIPGTQVLDLRLLFRFWRHRRGRPCTFRIGTETWGSILCPSAFCGVSGLRQPTAA